MKKIKISLSVTNSYPIVTYKNLKSHSALVRAISQLLPKAVKGDVIGMVPETELTVNYLLIAAKKCDALSTPRSVFVYLNTLGQTTQLMDETGTETKPLLIPAVITLLLMTDKEKALDAIMLNRSMLFTLGKLMQNPSTGKDKEEDNPVTLKALSEISKRFPWFMPLGNMKLDREARSKSHNTLLRNIFSRLYKPGYFLKGTTDKPELSV